MAVQVALGVGDDTGAGNVLVHASTDVDRVDLNEAVVREGGGEVGMRLSQTRREQGKAAGGGAIVIA